MLSVLWRCRLGSRKGIQPVKTEWWGVGVVICLVWAADLHTAQLMPLPLTVSCFSKIQSGVAFLVPTNPGSPGQRAVKRVCVIVGSIDLLLWLLLVTIKLLAYFKQRTVDNSLFAADVLLELYSYTEEPEFFINKKCFDEISLDFRKFDCCLTGFLFLKLNDSGITFMSSRSVQILALCRQM